MLMHKYEKQGRLNLHLSWEATNLSFLLACDIVWIITLSNHNVAMDMWNTRLPNTNSFILQSRQSNGSNFFCDSPINKRYDYWYQLYSSICVH